MKKILKKQTVILVVLITALLSCLVIALTGAKYSSQITGTATMVAAKFDVKVTGEPSNFSLTEENFSANFDFSVTSTSEVDVTYDVLITMPTGTTLPDGVTFTLKISNSTINPTQSENVYIFSDINLLKFTANGGTNAHTLTVTANDSAFANDVTINDIKIDVVATQVQTNA